MSHHGTDPLDGPEGDSIRKLLHEMKSTTSNFRGPIGAYPHGMLSKADEGSLQFAIGDKDGKVVIDFGSPVAWIGLTAQDAMNLASALMKRARHVAAQTGETVHVMIGG